MPHYRPRQWPRSQPSERLAGATLSVSAMSSIGRDARLKSAEYDRRAATARDPEIRQYYIQLARDWQEMARQGDQLEADLRDLARKEN